MKTGQTNPVLWSNYFSIAGYACAFILGVPIGFLGPGSVAMIAEIARSLVIAPETIDDSRDFFRISLQLCTLACLIVCALWRLRLARSNALISAAIFGILIGHVMLTLASLLVVAFGS